MRFACQTMFDITVTGVTGHYKATQPSFIDRAGQHIIDATSWHNSRNQQRNWETLTQILSLRTQLFDLTEPVLDSSSSRWLFEFETETPGVFGDDSDPVSVLTTDADNVPMLQKSVDNHNMASFLITHGPNQNIWFAPISINN